MAESLERPALEGVPSGEELAEALASEGLLSSEEELAEKLSSMEDLLSAIDRGNAE